MKCENLPKHSNKLKIFTILLVALVTAGALFLIPARAAAQMFSVGEQRGPRFNDPNSNIYLGLEPITVTYKGGSDAANVTGLFEFEGPLLRIGYENRNLELDMGLGGTLTGNDNVSYFDIGGRFNFGFSLSRSQKFSLFLPVQIASRFVNMTNSEVVTTNYNRFRFGSLMAGAGLQFLARPAENIRVAGSVIPKYGFAFSSGGLFGGGLGSVKAKTRLYLDRLIGKYGLSIGYAYDLRSYNIEQNVYDYDLKGHVFSIGVTF